MMTNQGCSHMNIELLHLYLLSKLLPIVLYPLYILSEFVTIYSISLSYVSPPVRKLHPCSNIISQLYKSTFLTTHLTAVLQPSRYSVFYGRDTPI